jgi:hypothetical protein
MCDLIPLLYHLPPTDACMPVLTVRYAPISVNPQRFGIDRRLVAKERYAMIFSQRYREKIGFHLDDYCYIYQTPYELRPELRDQYERLRYLIDRWLLLYRQGKSRLSYQLSEAGIEFIDSRFQEEPKVVAFGPDHARIYSAIVNRIALRRHLAAAFGSDLPGTTVEAHLGDFAAEGLIYQEGDKVLGLALPAAYYGRRAV